MQFSERFYTLMSTHKMHFSCFIGVLAHKPSSYYKTYAKIIPPERQIFRSADFYMDFQH